ncbi:MAG: hypothetical protein C0402_07870 [Thermodesulfovibrio sp.]|nr:hypothetical protein [Thermodesulfovibrio sp.]
MALEGSLTDFGLADILQLIYFQRKTGVLTLSGKMDRIRLLFIEGKITGAESKRRIDDNRLGKILLKKGFIKDGDLQTVLEEQKKTGTKIGSILIRRGLVEQGLIHEILSGQITETVIQLFSWKHGSYEFTAQGIPVDKELDLSLDTQHLLMEGLRIVDEWSMIKGQISLDTLYRKTGDEPASPLSEDEAEVFSFVDGENDVSTVIDFTGKDNFLVSKTLLSLLEKKLIESVDPVQVREEAENITAAGRQNLLDYAAPASLLAAVLLSFLVMFLQPNNYIKEYRASVKISELRSSLETYKIEHGAYPETLEAISTVRDPWRKPFRYRVADGAFSLLSTGVDGAEGTADDIY